MTKKVLSSHQALNYPCERVGSSSGDETKFSAIWLHDSNLDLSCSAPGRQPVLGFFKATHFHIYLPLATCCHTHSHLPHSTLPLMKCKNLVAKQHPAMMLAVTTLLAQGDHGILVSLYINGCLLSGGVLNLYNHAASCKMTKLGALDSCNHSALSCNNFYLSFF